jgi:hypothetical protein
VTTLSDIHCISKLFFNSEIIKGGNSRASSFEKKASFLFRGRIFGLAVNEPVSR